MRIGELSVEKSKLITEMTRVQNQVNSLRSQFANVLGRAPPPGSPQGAIQQHDNEKNVVKAHITQALPVQGGMVASLATREEGIRTQLNNIMAPLNTLMNLLDTQKTALADVSQEMTQPNLGSDQQVLDFLQDLEKKLEKAIATNRTIWMGLNQLK
ncbi:MAG: hypothetical protein AABX70_00065 [Nanoarchaeota archaeon]